jgi:anti-sigma factor RsiW
MVKMTCREATRLLLEAEDHPISAADRAVLEAHVRLCTACERFVAQVGFMRRAFGAWRKHADDDEPPPS